MRALCIFLLLYCNASFAQDVMWTQCVSANKYDYSIDGKYKIIYSPIKFCWNNYAFGYWAKGDSRIHNTKSYESRVSITKPPFGEIELTSIDDNTSSFPSFIVTITYSNPAEININYTRFGGFSYHFKTKELPIIKDKSIENLKQSGPVYNYDYGAYTKLDTMPKFTGGDFVEYLLANYGDRVKKYGKSYRGNYSFSFGINIDKNGQYSFSGFSQSTSCEPCDHDFAVYLSNIKEKWVPGILMGNPVKTHIKISIDFTELNKQ